jgi:hypothetical protein
LEMSSTRPKKLPPPSILSISSASISRLISAPELDGFYSNLAVLGCFTFLGLGLYMSLDGFTHTSGFFTSIGLSGLT